MVIIKENFVDDKTLHFSLDNRVVEVVKANPTIARQLCLQLSDTLKDEVLETDTPISEECHTEK